MGLNKGAGAPPGNQNALKHGYYVRGLRPAEVANIEELTERSLYGELVLARVMLMRLVTYLDSETLTAGEMAELMRCVFRGIRTIGYLQGRMGDGQEDFWDAVLDGLSEELGVEL